MARRGHFGTRDISRRIVPSPASPNRNAASTLTVRGVSVGSIDKEIEREKIEEKWETLEKREIPFS